MRLCKDCKHVRPGEDGTLRFARCAKLAPSINVVNGKPTTDNFCEAARLNFDFVCGTEARWFEPKGKK